MESAANHQTSGSPLKPSPYSSDWPIVLVGLFFLPENDPTFCKATIMEFDLNLKSVHVLT